MKVDKDYNYIPDLLRDITHRRLMSTLSLHEHVGQRKGFHPRSIQPTIAASEKPSRAELLSKRRLQLI